MTPISTIVTHPSSPVAEPRTATARKHHLLFQILRPIASLRVTIVLFVLGFLLVFFGTLAQINSGLWTVMAQYFRSWFVWVPFQLFAEFFRVFLDQKNLEWKGSFPFPAGTLIGFALLINLLAAHIVRFRMTWKRSGIFLIHIGVIVLMLGEYFTGKYAVEYRMTLQKGETADFFDDSRAVELVVRIPASNSKAKEVCIPGSMLAEKGWIRDDRLPIDVKVEEYLSNTSLIAVSGDETDEEVVIQDDGKKFRFVPSREESGVKSSQEDAPAVRIELFKKGTQESLGKHFLSLWQYRNFLDARRSIFCAPKSFTLEGMAYGIELRSQRMSKSYNIELLHFEHKLYPGTNKPKEYASTIQLRDPESGEDREVLIRMNEPLRFRGLTHYQAGFIPDNSGTVLQVVENPVWILPYISCSIVGLGMLIHFGLTLTNYQRRRVTA